MLRLRTPIQRLVGTRSFYAYADPIFRKPIIPKDIARLRQLEKGSWGDIAAVDKVALYRASWHLSRTEFQSLQR